MKSIECSSFSEMQIFFHCKLRSTGKLYLTGWSETKQSGVHLRDELTAAILLRTFFVALTADTALRWKLAHQATVSARSNGRERFRSFLKVSLAQKPPVEVTARAIVEHLRPMQKKTALIVFLKVGEGSG